MSMVRVSEALRTHRLAALRGAAVVPARDGWRVTAGGQVFMARDLAEVTTLLLSLPLATTGGIFRQPSEAYR